MVTTHASTTALPAGDRSRAAHGGRGARAIALLIMLVAVLLPLSPAPALARSYDMSRVTVMGEATADGDFWVGEARTYDFDGTYHAVFWEIPLANATGVDVLAVGEFDSNGNHLGDYRLGTGEQPGVYNVERSASKVTVTANFEKTDVRATFSVRYVVHGAVKAWADTGEVNWQAIGPEWSQASNGVTVLLRLPVPEGERVELGDNVRAWVDGPLDGTVGYDEGAGAIRMECPRVAPGQYLSVLCAFPVGWLGGMTPSPQERLAAMMQMGAENAERANAQRGRAQMIATVTDVGSQGIAGLGSLLGLGAVAFQFFKVGREHSSTFNDKYWRDVPSDDHPAVIGSLWRWGKTKPEDLTATLMKLTDEGVIKLERVTRVENGLLGPKTVEDFRLLRDPEKAGALTDRIDAAAMKLVFDTVRVGGGDLRRKGWEKGAGDGGALGEADEDAFLFSDFARCAKEDAERYKKRYDSWTRAVDNAAGKRAFYEAEGELWRGRAIGIAVALFLVGGAAAFAQSRGGGKLWPAAVPIAAALACLFFAGNMRRRSREANEVAKKTGALRNWLVDFTNLKEAVPTDVVLWDKLLVLSVVLGVSDKVVRQLAASAPQVLESDALAGSYYWCLPLGDAGSPRSAFASSLASAQALSAAELAATAAADVGGGSGGFGGGGFGGSFGGGSFGGGGGGAR